MNNYLSTGASFILALLVMACDPLDSDPEQHARSRTLSILDALATAIDFWAAEHGRVPTSGERFTVLGLKKSNPSDAWGNDIRYESSGDGKSARYLLYSVGSDGIDEGGRNDDVVWNRP